MPQTIESKNPPKFRRIIIQKNKKNQGLFLATIPSSGKRVNPEEKIMEVEEWKQNSLKQPTRIEKKFHRYFFKLVGKNKNKNPNSKRGKPYIPNRLNALFPWFSSGFN